jgi:fatty acyl-CoA reductase
VFDIVRTDSKIAVESKFLAIQGDMAQRGLGLSTQDRHQLCREVSIVFHVAATVRFGENHKVAIQTNVVGTQGVVGLCKEMSNITVSYDGG